MGKSADAGKLSMRATALLCCAALSLAACSKSPEERAEEAIEKATGHEATVTKNGEQVTIKADGGSVTIRAGDSLKLPATFPKDVFLPKGHTVKSVMETDGATLVTVEAPGELAAMSADASAAMQRDGWKEMMSMQDAANRMLVYSKDKRSASMSFGAEGEKITLVVQVGEEKQ